MRHDFVLVRDPYARPGEYVAWWECTRCGRQPSSEKADYWCPGILSG